MMSPIIEDRPNCEEILNQKHSWVLTPDEFGVENKLELEDVLKYIFETKSGVRSISHNFIYSIILSKLHDLSFQTGRYTKFFKENVFIDTKNTDVFYAIKTLKMKEIDEQSLKELQNISFVKNLLEKYVIENYEMWLENSGDDQIELYINKIKLCDTTLRKIIDEFHFESNMKLNESLSPIGYYIASQLFIELLEGVNYLHGKNIIHKYLKPSDIFLEKEKNGRTTIKVGGFDLIFIHEWEEKYLSENRYSKYIAPEISDGEIPTTKADIYSLGKILKDLLLIDIYE
jgi:serine/threonine protein kinase